MKACRLIVLARALTGDWRSRAFLNLKKDCLVAVRRHGAATDRRETFAVNFSYSTPVIGNRGA
jgi:hypothetical protein